MSRRTANITLTVLLLALIGLMVWMFRALQRLEDLKGSRHQAAPAATLHPPGA